MLALLQLITVLIGVVCAAVCRKVFERLFGGEPLPAVTEYYLRYAYVLVAVPLLWVSVASWAVNRNAGATYGFWLLLGGFLFLSLGGFALFALVAPFVPCC